MASFLLPPQTRTAYEVCRNPPAPRSRQSGFSLIDLTLVLAVVLGMIGVAVSMSGKVNGTAETVTVAQQIMTIKHRVDGYYWYRDGYDQPPLTPQLAIDEGLVPHAMVSGKKIVTSLGAELDLSTAKNGNEFVATLQVPADNCARLAQMLRGQFYRIAVSRGAGEVDAQNHTSAVGRLEPATKAAVCQGGSTGMAEIHLYAKQHRS